MFEGIKALKNGLFHKKTETKKTPLTCSIDVEDKLVKSEQNTPLNSLKEVLSPEEMKKAVDREAFMKTAQAGDVLLCRNTSNLAVSTPFKIFEWVAFNSPWSHAGMYVGDGTVIDATSKRSVSKRDLEEYFNFYKVSIYRPNYKNEEDKQKTINYIQKEIGTPFDTKFNMESDDKVYCTELVYKALLAGFDEDEKKDPMLPLDTVLNKELVTPMTFMNSPLLKKVEVPDEKNYFWSVTKKELKTSKLVKVLQQVFHRDTYIKNAAYNAYKLAAGAIGAAVNSFKNLNIPPNISP